MRTLFAALAALPLLLGACEAPSLSSVEIAPSYGQLQGAAVASDSGPIDHLNLKNSLLNTGGTGSLAVTSGNLIVASAAGVAVDAAAPVPLAAVMSPASPTAETRPAQRILIYSAQLCMTVRDVRATQTAIQALAESLGGYLQELAQDSITVRIPAAKFQSAVADTEKLGEVTQRAMKAQDITEEMRDLRIRLDNAEKTRERLQAILEKLQKTEDILKAEQELERVTQTIELLKGKIQYLSSQAAFSTLRVVLNSPLPQRQMVAQIPFAWVREIGNGLVAGVAEANADASRWEKRGTRFELPKSYIRYYERDQLTEAMSAEGMLLKLQRHDNYKGGDLEFWASLCRRALVENRAVAIDKSADVTLKTGATARIFTGTKDMGGKPFGYLLAIVANDKRVYTFEAWGPQSPFTKDRPAIDQAITTLEIDK